MNFDSSSNQFSQHFLQSNDDEESYYGIGDSLVITKVDQDQESKEESKKKMVRGGSNKQAPGSISITSATPTPANIPTPGRIARGRNSANSNASVNSDDGAAEESSNKKLFKCSICNYLTAVKARFTKHIKYHSMPLIKCEFCGFKTPYKWNLDRHLRNHGGGGALTCPLCNFTAEIKQSLTVHIQNHHSDVGSERISELVGSVLKQQGGAFQHGQQQLINEPSLFPGQHFLNFEDDDVQPYESVEKSQQHNQPLKPRSSTSSGISTPNLKSSLPTANISKPVSNSIKSKSSTSTVTQNQKGNGNNTDFIHPDDIIEKNGKVYIKKLSCKFCDYRAHFETEMSRHMSKDHGFNLPKRKSSAESISISIANTPNSSTPTQSKKMPSLIPIQKSPPSSDIDNDNSDEREQQIDKKQEKNTDKKSFLESLCLKPKGIPSSTTMTITSASSTSVNMKNSNDKDNEMVITPVVQTKISKKSDDTLQDLDELDDKMDITACLPGDQQNNYNNNNESKNKLPKLTRAPSPSNSVKSDDSQPPITIAAPKYRPPQPPTLKPITGSTSSKMIIDMKKKRIIPGGQISVSKVPQSQQQQSLNNNNQIKSQQLSVQQNQQQQQQQQQAQQKKVLWKCKKCEFRHSSKELVVYHIREYHKPKKGESVSILKGNNMTEMGEDNDHKEAEAENKSFQGETTQYMYNEKTFGCKFCPYKVGSLEEMETHSENHFSKPDCNFSCSYCSYSVSTKMELMDHLQLHGDSPGNEAGEEDSKKRKRVLDPTLTISQEETPPKPRDYGNSPFKKYHCAKCPYETSSKGQFLYHKQFHQPVNAPFKCGECSYNVSHKHLLHQHLRVHGLSTFQIDQEDQNFMNDNDEETVQPKLKRLKTQQQQYGQYDDHDQMNEGSSQVDEAMPSSHPTKVIWQNGKSYRIFQCRMCPLIFNQVDDLTDHETTNHGISPPTGKRIQNRQENMMNLEQHDQIDKKMNDDSASPSKISYLYLCDECPARYPFEKEYQIHKTFHQKEYPYRCNLCTYSARQNNPHLLSHMKVHTDDYQRKTEFLLQTMTVFPNNSTISPLNSQGSSSDKLRNELLKGKSSANSSSPQLKKQFLTCAQCPASFISSEALKEHHYMVHQPKVFNCQMCDFVCDNETILLIHNQKHDESTSHLSASEIKLPPFDAEREAEAFVGNPEFVYPTLLKNGRVRTKRYKCKKCPSAFEKRDQYYVHIGLHGSNQRYKCSICDYSVTFYANFIQHVKKHATQENVPRELLVIKPLSKPRKGYSSFDGFNTEEMVKDSSSGVGVPIPAAKEIHPVHHKNSIWKCNRCPFKAVDKRSLEQHLNHHKLPIRSAKTLTCNFCDFSINQIQSMKEHMLLHFSTTDNSESADSYMILDDIEIYAEVGKDREKLFVEKENYNFDGQSNKYTDDGEKESTNPGEDLKITYVDIKTGIPILPIFGENNDVEDN